MNDEAFFFSSFTKHEQFSIIILVGPSCLLVNKNFLDTKKRDPHQSFIVFFCSKYLILNKESLLTTLLFIYYSYHLIKLLVNLIGINLSHNK